MNVLPIFPLNGGVGRGNAVSDWANAHVDAAGTVTISKRRTAPTTTFGQVVIPSSYKKLVLSQ